MTIATKLAPLLEPLMAAVRYAEQFLGPEDDWVENDRRILYQAADVVLRPLGRPAISNVGKKDYITTVNASSDVVEVALEAHNYQRNVLSTRKYRIHHDGGKQWADGGYVFDPPSKPWQHHVYVFDTEYGRADVYAHKEPSVRQPYEHTSGDHIEYGAPMGLFDMFDHEGLTYGERKI